MFVDTIFCMIPHHFKQETTTYRKNWSRHQAHRWWRRRSALSMVIPEKYIFFIWKKAWMTRKISAESWKEAVFEIPLSPWAFLEYFTQGKPFYSVYIYIRYLDSRTTTKFPWVNHSRELKGIEIWRKNRATDLFPVIIRARLLCDLSSKNDGKKLIQLEDYGV